MTLPNKQLMAVSDGSLAEKVAEPRDEMYCAIASESFSV
jgi:hypothetical protein